MKLWVDPLWISATSVRKVCGVSHPVSACNVISASSTPVDSSDSSSSSSSSTMRSNCDFWHLWPGVYLSSQLKHKPRLLLRFISSQLKRFGVIVGASWWFVCRTLRLSVRRWVLSVAVGRGRESSTALELFITHSSKFHCRLQRLRLKHPNIVWYSISETAYIRPNERLLRPSWHLILKPLKFSVILPQGTGLLNFGESLIEVFSSNWSKSCPKFFLKDVPRNWDSIFIEGLCCSLPSFIGFILEMIRSKADSLL